MSLVHDYPLCVQHQGHSIWTLLWSSWCGLWSWATVWMWHVCQRRKTSSRILPHVSLQVGATPQKVTPHFYFHFHIHWAIIRVELQIVRWLHQFIIAGNHRAMLASACSCPDVIIRSLYATTSHPAIHLPHLLVYYSSSSTDPIFVDHPWHLYPASAYVLKLLDTLTVNTRCIR